MPAASPSSTLTLSDFFAASDRRSDCWAKLSVAARAWAAAAGRGQPTEALVAEVAASMSEIAPPTAQAPRAAASLGALAATRDGVRKMPAPTTVPTMIATTSITRSVGR